jgi:hypothetical protein
LFVRRSREERKMEKREEERWMSLTSERDL